eukprot:Sspe_Gene.117425::Locus_108591_Transcript_1_1_Confidence_1.000_Length_2423::g.117425::m.117425
MYASLPGYIFVFVGRTITWMALANIVLLCDNERASAGGLISKCTLHKSLQLEWLAIVWLTTVNLLVLLQLIFSVFNVVCNNQQQCAASNVVAPICAAVVFASVGVTMGSLGVWWGFIGLPCFLFGPGVIIAVKGRSVLTKTFAFNIVLRILHTWDVVTDFATASLIGVDTPIGVVYASLSCLNFLIFVVTLYTQLGEMSLLRVVLHLVKALTMDGPMVVLDIILLAQGDKPADEMAIILISAITSMLELIGAVRAAVTFHTVTKQHAQMKRTVRLATDVAEALAKFDLDAASLLVKEGQDKEEDHELCEAFRALLDSLRLYRPYLPAVMFPNEEISDSSDPAKVAISTSSSIPASDTPPFVPATASTSDSQQALSPKAAARGGEREAPDPVKIQDVELVADSPATAAKDVQQDRPRKDSVTSVGLALPVNLPSIVLTGPPLLPNALHKMTVGVIVVRLSPLCRTAASRQWRDKVQFTTYTFLKVLFIEARSHRGVMHSFDAGYEAVITFGTVTPSRTVATDALACASAIVHGLSDPGYKKAKGIENQSCFIGVSVAESVVGNMGAGGRLAFSIAGPALHRARVACDVAEQLDVPIICDERVGNKAPDGALREAPFEKYNYHCSAKLWQCGNLFIYNPERGTGRRTHGYHDTRVNVPPRTTRRINNVRRADEDAKDAMAEKDGDPLQFSTTTVSTPTGRAVATSFIQLLSPGADSHEVSSINSDAVDCEQHPV